MPVKVVELLNDDKPGGDKLKQLLDQRAAQELGLNGLVDDYAAGVLDRAELSRAKARPKPNYHGSTARLSFWKQMNAGRANSQIGSRFGKPGKPTRVAVGVER